MTGAFYLCHVGDLPEFGARGFDPERTGRDTVFIVRRGATLHAYHDVCPHYGQTPLPWRKDAYLNAAGARIVCGAHGAEFEIETGLCTQGPCLGQSLTRMPLRIDEDGAVFALEAPPRGLER